jgi:preprotein translocase subunit SecG
MGTLLISLLTLVLLLISAFVILIVLMQRTSQNGGMGAALGGGAAESAFGSETNNILTKGTVYGIIAFFLVALGLYLLYQAQAAEAVKDVDMNALISAKEESPVAETHTAVVDAASSDAGSVATVDAVAADLEGTSSALVESVESAVEAGAAEVEAQVEQAVESVDAAVSDSQPSAN